MSKRVFYAIFAGHLVAACGQVTFGGPSGIARGLTNGKTHDQPGDSKTVSEVDSGNSGKMTVDVNGYPEQELIVDGVKGTTSSPSSIMFVLQTSASMVKKLPRLADAIPTFVKGLKDKGANVDRLHFASMQELKYVNIDAYKNTPPAGPVIAGFPAFPSGPGFSGSPRATDPISSQLPGDWIVNQFSIDDDPAKLSNFLLTSYQIPLAQLGTGDFGLTVRYENHPGICAAVENVVDTKVFDDLSGKDKPGVLNVIFVGDQDNSVRVQHFDVETQGILQDHPFHCSTPVPVSTVDQSHGSNPQPDSPPFDPCMGQSVSLSTTSLCKAPASTYTCQDKSQPNKSQTCTCSVPTGTCSTTKYNCSFPEISCAVIVEGEDTGNKNTYTCHAPSGSSCKVTGSTMQSGLDSQPSCDGPVSCTSYTSRDPFTGTPPDANSCTTSGSAMQSCGPMDAGAKCVDDPISSYQTVNGVSEADHTNAAKYANCIADASTPQPAFVVSTSYGNGEVTGITAAACPAGVVDGGPSSLGYICQADLDKLGPLPAGVTATPGTGLALAGAPAVDPATPDSHFLTDKLAAFLPGVRLVVHVIGNLDGKQCEGEDKGKVAKAVTFMELASQTNGIAADVCKSSYEDIAASLAENIATNGHMVVTYPLKGVTPVTKVIREDDKSELTLNVDYSINGHALTLMKELPSGTKLLVVYAKS